MRVTSSARARTGPRRAAVSRGWLVGVAVLLAIALVALAPGRAAAFDDQPTPHNLWISLKFPDSGLSDGEQLCLGLYPSGTTDFSVPPLQSRCLDPGQSSATFEGIAHGDYQVVVPSVGSVIGSERYQGQAVSTTVPDEPNQRDFVIDVTLGLTPEVAGTTGKVQVNVRVCPPGTNGGGDATAWESECTGSAAGVPVTLQGVGSIEDTSIPAVTPDQGDASGRIEFTNLPAGAYDLNPQLPENVDANPALFVESNIDGSIGPVDPDSQLDLRPAEVKVVNVYLVLNPDQPDAAANGSPAPAEPPVDDGNSANPDIGTTSAAPSPAPAVAGVEPTVTGGLSPDEAADRAAQQADEDDGR